MTVSTTIRRIAKELRLEEGVDWVRKERKPYGNSSFIKSAGYKKILKFIKESKRGRRK